MSNLDLNSPSAGELIDSAPPVKDGSKGARNIKRVQRDGYGGKTGKGKQAGSITQPIWQPHKTRYEMRRNMLNLDFETWRSHYLDVKNLFDPYGSRWLDDGGLPNRGNKKMQYIVDNCPMLALRTMGAGLMAGMTSPSRPWFRMRPDEEDELQNSPGVMEWCERVTDAIHRILQKSNFYRAVPRFYKEVGAYGTAPIAIYENEYDANKRQPLINCVPYTVGEYRIAQDDQSLVNIFVRRYKWTVHQIVERFVENPDDPDDPTWSNLLPSTVALWRSRKWDVWIDVIHVIEPNDSWEIGMLGTEGMQCRSVYYELGGNPDTLLAVKGFPEMPVFVARWDTNSDNVYGHSPAMYCLGDSKQLMIQQKRKMQAIDKQMEPPLIGDASLKRQTVSQLPGDITWLEVTAATTFGLKPLYEVKPDITAMIEDLNETRKRIRAGMYEDVFQMMRSLEDTLKAGITATEINARKQEQLLELGPLLDRLNGEVFGPIIERIFKIATRRSKLAWQNAAAGLPHKHLEMYFPPPPPALQGRNLEVDYISILAQAVRVAEIQGINQTTQYVLMLAQAKPDVLDKVNFDKAIEIIADRTGTPPECIVADPIVQKIRQQRAEAQAKAQQQEQMAQAIPAAAQAAKNLSQTPIGGGNALEQLLGGATGGA